MSGVKLHKKRNRRDKRIIYMVPNSESEFSPYYSHRYKRLLTIERGGDFVTRTQDNTRLQRIVLKKQGDQPFKSLMEKYMKMPRKQIQKTLFTNWVIEDMKFEAIHRQFQPLKDKWVLLHLNNLFGSMFRKVVKKIQELLIYKFNRSLKPFKTSNYYHRNLQRVRQWMNADQLITLSKILRNIYQIGNQQADVSQLQILHLYKILLAKWKKYPTFQYRKNKNKKRQKISKKEHMKNDQDYHSLRQSNRCRNLCQQQQQQQKKQLRNVDSFRTRQQRKRIFYSTDSFKKQVAKARLSGYNHTQVQDMLIKMHPNLQWKRVTLNITGEKYVRQGIQKFNYLARCMSSESSKYHCLKMTSELVRDIMENNSNKPLKLNIIELALKNESSKDIFHEIKKMSKQLTIEK